ncbi:alcohol dehydrogenase catalytic domain-containing protein [Profundibacter sp.]|uniref:alcohol dehydrogenase catalytic domain-containing protein n=1 Tax=Profundibacter sp. TaxID=3101071 RepID=UPI003D1063AC
MKASVYFGPKDIRAIDVPDAKIKNDHEMLVEVSATSICGSDLHLYRGALDGIMEKGRSQTGHELIGIVRETGKGVGNFRPGDRVTMAYSCSCGECYTCQVGQTAHCETTGKAVYGFGVAFGDLNGTHAEALVLPHADAHALKVPDTIADNAALTLSCNLPSAVIANRLAAIEPGENVALIGLGPTGLMSLDIALQRAPGKVLALDPVVHRRKAAAEKGVTVLDPGSEGWKETALEMVEGRGFDKVIEVVGTPESLQMSLDLIRPGGTIAAIGVFTDTEFNLVPMDVFLRDITLHMNGFANVQPFMWDALRLMERGVIDPSQYFTHEFSLADIDKSYAAFFGKEDGINKVLIRP